MFFHEGGCLTVRAGDVVLYDTRRSYLFGFPTRMRQLLMDIPREIFAERCAHAELSAPVLDLVRSLTAPRLGGTSARLAMARSYIDRHLSRVFAPTGVTPARHILEQRLARAHEQLGDPGSRQLTVAEIAHRWGFAGQAHFTRVYRGRYGRTPGAARPR
ncbi:helix-turn-helix transcriptional regulator [Streptomyces sp. TLI_55]|uniref:helix-turn-helix transcriptional regulator n=1 Tax=Streptomyces sp. TLI_55 TaxID=1938861 RepID=UPI00211CA2C2|nr:helix-turn-helix transcriptional regulator [Streptomyces sp. TLI_55]